MWIIHVTNFLMLDGVLVPFWTPSGIQGRKNNDNKTKQKRMETFVFLFVSSGSLVCSFKERPWKPEGDFVDIEEHVFYVCFGMGLDRRTPWQAFKSFPRAQCSSQLGLTGSLWICIMFACRCSVDQFWWGWSTWAVFLCWVSRQRFLKYVVC